MEAEYSWQSLRTSGPGYHRDPVNRNYGWWVMLASVLAALFHVALFFAFDKIEVRRFGGSDPVFKLSQNRERITIDKLTERRLKDEERPMQEVKETKRPDPPNTPTEDLPLEMPQKVETIRLTPAVSEPQNLFAEAPAPNFAKPTDLGTVEDRMTFDLKEASAGEAVKNDLLKASQKISAQQPKIQIKASELQPGLGADEFVKQMTNTLGSADAAKIQNRFTPIDGLLDLVGSGKAMPENVETMIPTDLLFEFGSAEIKEEAKLSLMKLGMLIMARPKSTFLFKGFTDSIPFRFKGDRLGPKDNMQLSVARAEAVRNWLTKALDLRGFNLQVQGFGDSSPLVTTSPLESVDSRKTKEALNRRVEVEIISKK